jgi:hypothetical protein
VPRFDFFIKGFVVMSETPEDKKNTEENARSRGKEKVSPVAAVAWAGLCVTFLIAATTLPVWHDPVSDFLQAKHTDRVKALAVDAGAQAAALCASNDVGAKTYDTLVDLYDNSLFLNFGPYYASELAQVLTQMADKDIIVRAATNSLYVPYRTHAVFVKSDGAQPHMLVLGTLAKYNGLTANFMDQVLAQVETMEPGAALVLDRDHVRGQDIENIVAMAPGATAYAPPAANGNPFAQAVDLTLPKPGCAPF